MHNLPIASPRRSDVPATAERCKHQCPEGQPCCLRGNVPHTLHVCSNPLCPCHQRDRYEPNWWLKGVTLAADKPRRKGHSR